MSISVLPDSWFAVTEDEARAFESELKKEMSPSHPLLGVAAQCVARRKVRDDFLFQLTSVDRPLAVVHLTWSKEVSGDFPWTTFFQNEEDFSLNWRKIFE